jgi:hypothetical protein
VKVTEVAPAELGPAELERWEEIRAACLWSGGSSATDGRTPGG